MDDIPTENLLRAAEQLGPPFLAHMQAWTEMHNEDRLQKDPQIILRQAALELCSLSLFDSRGYTSPLGEAVRQLQTLNIVKVCQTEGWSIDRFREELRAAWKDHERIYPHPPGTILVYPFEKI